MTGWQEVGALLLPQQPLPCVAGAELLQIGSHSFPLWREVVVPPPSHQLAIPWQENKEKLAEPLCSVSVLRVEGNICRGRDTLSITLATDGQFVPSVFLAACFLGLFPFQECCSHSDPARSKYNQDSVENEAETPQDNVPLPFLSALFIQV